MKRLPLLVISISLMVERWIDLKWAVGTFLWNVLEENGIQIGSLLFLKIGRFLEKRLSL